MMQRSGPPLPAILRRLAETPADFLDEPRIGRSGKVVVAALLADVLGELGLAADPRLLARFRPDGGDPQDRNLFRLAMVAAWLLADEWLARETPSEIEVADLFLTAIPELAPQVRADLYVTDPDRREELARTVLARLGFRPEGESEAEAADRLSMISAAERSRLLAASRAAEQRAREVREALARKAAQESADKWTRE
jgi:hypothetical protein